jgi:hypothetical protein
MAGKKRSDKTAPVRSRLADDKAEDSRLAPAASQLELSAVISQKVRLEDVALVGLSMSRIDDVSELPLKLEFTQKSNAFGINEGKNQLVIRPTLSVAAFKLPDDTTIRELFISIEATFAIMYTCDDVSQFPAENLEAFANTNAIFNVWPFWRELVLNTSARMRITPIVVPLLRF